MATFIYELNARCVLDRGVGGAAEEDGSLQAFAHPHDSRAEVDVVAHGGVLGAVAATDITDNDLAGMDAGFDLEKTGPRRFGLQALEFSRRGFPRRSISVRIESPTFDISI
jgi:hypothetical protein